MKRNDRVEYIRGDVELTLRDAKTGKIKSVDRVKNVFVTTGKDSIASRLIGTDAKAIITYCGVGTSAVAPVAGNTELTTEIFRKLISVRSVSGNIATFTTFFTTSEANGALKEAGLFGDDASATADSGTLFCHTAINRTKTTGDTLSIVWNVTIG